MTEVYYPIDLPRDLQNEIYKFLDESREMGNKIKNGGLTILAFEDDELAVFFKLKFGL